VSSPENWQGTVLPAACTFIQTGDIAGAGIFPTQVNKSPGKLKIKTEIVGAQPEYLLAGQCGAHRAPEQVWRIVPGVNSEPGMGSLGRDSFVSATIGHIIHG